MTEKEKIKQEVLEWINKNQTHLPLNANSWEIQVFKKEDDLEKTEPIRLGKYKALLGISHPFSKPYSKMIAFKNGR